LFAASYPERTRALVLFHARAKGPTWHADARSATYLPALREGWGIEEWCDQLFREVWPSLSANEDDRQWFANSVRLAASPAVAYALNRAFHETDLRDVLPAVHVPTLLLYRSLPEAEAATMDVASRSPGGRARRVAGTDPGAIFLSPEIADEIDRLVAGEEAPAVPESVLATVECTNSVASTDHAARIGDSDWPDLLARH